MKAVRTDISDLLKGQPRVEAKTGLLQPRDQIGEDLLTSILIDHPSSVSWSQNGKTIAVVVISGNLLASGGDDNVVYIWDASRMNSTQFVNRFTTHVAAVKALAWCPHNFNVLASGGGMYDGCIKLWNTQYETCINTVETEAQVICGLEWNKNHKEIVVGMGIAQMLTVRILCLYGSTLL
ncbi:WD40/YVTN repeat-like-containing domain-containing protein [Artemisia annua]|uniref:WD40/YVTN repeat-like-containing domain-containing protein n=1 Tax=Artemisia annua TaxID=35608 RepID=A0A2U1NTH3_ARTAN|nr:WD40/YVTN repeat-like-containing domain-containing protein [Artemisia annua]